MVASTPLLNHVASFHPASLSLARLYGAIDLLCLVVYWSCQAIGVIDAPVEKVFELFLDNTRVHEYNEHCRYTIYRLYLY